jgi:hypothetical protein
VRPGHKMLKQYFSCLGGPGAVSIKSELGHVTPHLYFCIWWDLWVTSCIPMRLGHDMSINYFSCLSGPGAVSIKSVAKHVTMNLFICIRGIHGARSAFQCVRDTKCDRDIFHAWVGPTRMSQKVRRDMLRRTCVFATGGICGSHSAF